MKTGYVLASLAVAFSMTAAAPIEQEMAKKWSSEPQQCFAKCSPALGFGLGFGAAVSANVAAGAGVIATPLGAGAGAGVNAGVAVSAGLGL
ncbi:hypothetical protein E5Q_05156 [Mixia osmundae IAM 14324]|uniref:Uncharacterized protein n=1 Tax=Mixia osmundae (strain CBS 9802 / IAM 14324 / JCM 22182 / KY 12970) TaxID=764103 RepID=G7E6L0_MIXOS|nr:hypothetical protein E5Q_05156 [Mixia osmundae IAM 14324]